jgi:hypothetical protein
VHAGVLIGSWLTASLSVFFATFVASYTNDEADSTAIGMTKLQRLVIKMANLHCETVETSNMKNFLIYG